MLQSDLYRAAAKVNMAKLARNEQMRKFEYQHKPFKRGDKTTITGYAFTGRKCLVKKCTLKYRKYSNMYYWSILAKVVNVDGKVGKNVVRFDRECTEGK